FLFAGSDSTFCFLPIRRRSERCRTFRTDFEDLYGFVTALEEIWAMSKPAERRRIATGNGRVLKQEGSGLVEWKTGEEDLPTYGEAHHARCEVHRWGQYAAATFG